MCVQSLFTGVRGSICTANTSQTQLTASFKGTKYCVGAAAAAAVSGEQYGNEVMTNLQRAVVSGKAIFKVRVILLLLYYS